VPEQLSRRAEGQRQLIEEQRRFGKRLARVEEGQRQLGERFSAVEEGQRQLREAQSHLAERFARVEEAHQQLAARFNNQQGVYDHGLLFLCLFQLALFCCRLLWNVCSWKVFYVGQLAAYVGDLC
jgi:hypothetical protein